MKYFITSDIHSYFSVFKEELNKQGFDINNQDHILIICGDLFDRGDESVELYKFLKQIPKERLILIKGNHEYLYLKLLDKEYPNSYDFSNGTVNTFCQIAKIDPKEMDYKYLLIKGLQKIEQNTEDIRDTLTKTWNKIREKVEKSNMTKFIKSKAWKNYYELDEYIFVHSFIPTKLKEEVINKFSLYIYGATNPDYFEYDPNWRNSTKEQFEDATWGNPWTQYRNGLFDKEAKNGKILVCGHWHTSDFYKYLAGYEDEETQETCPIYYGKNIIALDACTVHTNRCNILVIEK